MFNKQRSSMLMVAAAVLAAAVFAVDLNVPLGFAGGVPYVAVVGLGWWLPKRRYIFVLAVVSTVLTLTGYVFSPPGGVAWVVLANRLMALFAIWVTAVLLFMIRKEERARKQSEERAEGMLFDAIEGLSDEVALYDADERFVFCNSYYRKNRSELDDLLVPGVSVEDVCWFSVRGGFIPGVDKDNDQECQKWVNERLARFRAPGDPEIRNLDDGRWVSIKDYKTKDGGTFVIQTDITKTKRSEELLREEEERFRDLAESAMDWYWEMDAALRFTFVSENYYKITGRTPGDIIGKTRTETVDKTALEASTEDWRKHWDDLEARRPFSNFIQSNRGAEGSRFEGRRYYLRLAGRPRFDKAGEFIGYRGTASDITRQIEAEHEIIKARDELEERVVERTRELMEEVEERKRMELDLRRAKEAAEYSDRTKSEFLANMSHELRTPLNSIIGFSDMLRGEVLGAVGNPRYIEYSNDINASGRHLLDLIKDILDVSKIEAGAMDMVDERVDIGAAVSTSVTMIDERARQAGVIINRDIPGDLAPLLGDSLRVKQILLNLIGNAVKFTPPEGRVTVTAGLGNNGGLFVAVKDTGVGIDKKDLPHVTEPFSQGSRPMTRGREGTGLGLALAKTLVELHDGQLIIESELGRGTEVTILFPKERTLPPQ